MLCGACRELARSTRDVRRRGVGECARTQSVRSPQLSHSTPYLAVQRVIGNEILRPLHLIIRRYPAYHMTARPQWHASSEKDRIPGLHRPPGHSKSRSSEHMQSMMHVPRGALEELDHSTLLLRPLSVLCRSHLQVIPRPCGGIEQHLMLRCSAAKLSHTTPVTLFT